MREDRILMEKPQGRILFRNPMHIHDVSIKWMLEFKFDSNRRKSTNMQQFHILCVAQHVSGASPPIIRSIQLH
jgi:hypothetical protein